MWAFKGKRIIIAGRRLALLLSVLFLSLLPSTGQALEPSSSSAAIAAIPAKQEPDGTIKIYQSTFNELAAAIEPLEMNGNYKLRVRLGICPLCKTVTICDSAWSASVTELDFDIDTTGVDITGEVAARWCSLSFSADLASTGDAVYSSGQKAVLVTMGSTSVRPYFSILGYNVYLPAIDAGPSLTLDPIPVTTAFFSFETARGSKSLRLTPRNTSLFKRNGYIELQSDFIVW